jgi:hypothetical protein
MKSCKESSGGWLSFANNPNRTTGGRSRTLAEATRLTELLFTDWRLAQMEDAAA